MSNALKIPLGPYPTLRRESRAQPRDARRPRGENPESFLSLTSVATRLCASTLTGHSSAARFSEHRSSYDATISPHFKYSPISAGTILYISGYLGMPIPTIVHNHHNSYGRISTCKSCCRGIRTIGHKNTYTPRDP